MKVVYLIDGVFFEASCVTMTITASICQLRFPKEKRYMNHEKHFPKEVVKCFLEFAPKPAVTW